MRRNDLFDICLQNLRRRKARTALTVLGVIVGCCAIVIMVSIGVGMKEAQQKLLSELGDLTIITVYPQPGKKEGKITDDTIRQLRTIGRTVAVSPKADMSSDHVITLYAGPGRRYQFSYADIAGMDTSTMQELGYRMVEGD